MNNGLYALAQRSWGEVILASKFSELSFVHWVQDSEKYFEPIWSYKRFSSWGRFEWITPCSPYEGLVKLREEKLLKSFCPIIFFLILYIQAEKIYSSTARLKLWMLKIIKIS